MASIARRIRRTYFLISLGIISVMVTIVMLVSEDLEYTMLALDFEEESKFFLSHHNPKEVLFWESAALTALFVPDSVKYQKTLPSIFLNLPNKFSGEIEHNERTYLINTGKAHEGRFYIAKDITRFEDREVLFNKILAVASFCILGLSLLLSMLGSRRLVKPLQQLTEHIRSTPVSQRMPRLPLVYPDMELVEIAETFNHFLDELEAFVKREHALVSQASHELRTPIAVISGALDVLDQRRQLQPNDALTLERIRKATREMEENIRVLLNLARHEAFKQSDSVFVPDLVKEVIEDLAEHFNTWSRIRLEIKHELCLKTDPVMAKMLIRNLLHNALQHTSGSVLIRLLPHQLSIVDEGPGLTPAQQTLLSQGFKEENSMLGLNGLGLYIATILCERLNWHLEVDQHRLHGTGIHVFLSS